RMTRLGETLAGVPAILAAFAKRPTDLLTRHLISNLLIETEAEVASAHFLMAVVRGRAASDAERPIRVASPWRVSDVKVGFERVSHQWRICHLTTQSQFEFDPSLAGPGARP